MKKAVVVLMILISATFGTLVPGSAHGEEPPPGTAPRKLYEWDTWPRKSAAPVVADNVTGQTPTDAVPETSAGASVGSRAGEAASAGILSGTTAKIVLIGAVVVGGAVALLSMGSSSGH